MNDMPCFYCGMPFDFNTRRTTAPLAFTVDHVVPVAAGGTDRLENLVPAHYRCNRAKSDTLVTPQKATGRKATRRW